MNPRSLRRNELLWSLACLLPLYRWGKLRSDSPETSPRSHGQEVLFLPSPPVLPSGMLSTHGLQEEMGLGDPPTDPQGGPGLSRDTIPDMGPFGRARGVGGWGGCQLKNRPSRAWGTSVPPPSLRQLAPPCPAARLHSGLPLGAPPTPPWLWALSPPPLPSLQADGALTEPGWA